VALAFRPLGHADLPQLATWLGRPHVAQWWREPSDLTSVETRYIPCIDGAGPTELFVIEKDSRPIGMVQRYLVADDQGWKAALEPFGLGDCSAGIDYLIGEETEIGQGTGPEVIRQFVEMVWERYQGAKRVVVNVSQENRRSWRALEKAGFSRAWSGELMSQDPSDDGPTYLYVKERH
jgi:aminoglycoside 6'-N-acetyltransferase